MSRRFYDYSCLFEFPARNRVKNLKTSSNSYVYSQAAFAASLSRILEDSRSSAAGTVRKPVEILGAGWTRRRSSLLIWTVVWEGVTPPPNTSSPLVTVQKAWKLSLKTIYKVLLKVISLRVYHPNIFSDVYLKLYFMKKTVPPHKFFYLFSSR